MFFAFAGYARIATLGEEVKDPGRTIPKAVPMALGAAFAVYLVSLIGALVAVGPEVLAHSAAPLETAARTVLGNNSADFVRLGAVIAVLGVLLSLLAGVSRTAFAMADDRELPKFLSAVSERTKVPLVTQLAAGAIVVAAVLVVPTAKAIATSSLLILTYYAIAHLSALRLSEADKRPKVLAPFGLVGCAALALNLPWRDVVTGVAILAVGLVVRAAVRALRRS
jgi:APA family basic amino acid/polyamine antiporter